MYYPQEIVDQVLAANDIVDVVGQYVSLKKSGANHFGLCPFHSEKSPSFSVSQSKQIFHCFGCGEGGNAVTFLMKYENATFQEALKSLADRAGIRLPEENYSEQARERAKEREELLKINKEAATYYYKMLRSPKGKAGLAYFEERKLSPQTMNAFGLGYADGSRSDLVAHLRKLGFSDELILASGVAAYDEKRGLHDKFFNRVMYPIMDASNKVIGFGGRVLGEGRPKYLNSPETPVFDKGRNLYGLNIARRSRADHFILCEGYMDVIAMHQAGFTQAIASLGTAFTDNQAQIIRRYVKNVLLAYDSDGAGVTAALRNIGILRRAGLTGKVVDMRPYKDPDEFMKALGREEFQKRLDNAENSFFYEIRQMEGSYDLKDPASRTQFYHEIARKLCIFTDEIERENYIRAMAEKYYIPQESLRKEVAGYVMIGEGEDTGTARPPQARGAQEQQNSMPSGGMPDPSDFQAERAVYSRPVSLSGERRLGAAHEARLRNQRLLMTWLSDDPALYPQIRGIINAEDFDEGLYREAAGRYFEMLEQYFVDPLHMASGAAPIGTISPASVISIFDTDAEQTEAAALFETRIEGVHDIKERTAALKDVLLGIKKATLDRVMKDPETAGKLDEILKLKKILATIPGMNLKLSE